MGIDSFSLFGIYGAALLLGAAHSLEPGHGKTVVAAYLVGSRGRSLDAVILGLVVTFTHSFSIILLGLLAKASSRFFTDQELHGYLGIVASLIILGIGIWLLRTRWLALRDPSRAHGHSHLFGGGHHHHDHSHGHRHDHDHTHAHAHGDAPVHGHSGDHDHDHDGKRQLGPVGLILLGISGGIVPCPAALAILLASASVGDIGKGLGLVLIFSLGLAISLMAIGLAVVNGVRVFSRFIDTERYAPKIAFASACIVTLVGVVTLWSSLTHFGAA